MCATRATAATALAPKRNARQGNTARPPVAKNAAPRFGIARSVRRLAKRAQRGATRCAMQRLGRARRPRGTNVPRALQGRLATVGVLQSARPGPTAQSVAPAGRITCGAMPGQACAAPVRLGRPPLEARPRHGRDVWPAPSVIGAMGRASNTSAEQARTTMRVGRKRPMPVNHVERIPNTAESGNPHVPRARQSASLPVETRTHTPHVRLVSRDIVATVPAPRPSV